DGIQIASPCHANWEQMAGSERVRFCERCMLHVYNLSAMTREEAEELVRQREGRLCVRFYQRNDGTALTQDCPVGWRAARRRVQLVAGGIASLFALLLPWFRSAATPVQGNMKELRATQPPAGLIRIDEPPHHAAEMREQPVLMGAMGVL